MNVNNNNYTFAFSAGMVIIVAILLSVAALGLKPSQDKNIELEKQQNILSAVGITVERDQAAEQYNSSIVGEYVLNASGEVISSEKKSAFNIDLSNELKKPEAERNFPLFECKKDGKTYFIVPTRGKGLWGPIWGYVAISDDYKTVSGATFDHKSETPGLGAEISTTTFTSQFNGKQIIDEKGEFVSITVIKKGTEPVSNYNVDGISGGTITSKGVDEMLRRTLKTYIAYFNAKAESLKVKEEPIVTDSTQVQADSTANLTTASIQ
jgi:Na+-transporting NADH:ubiquinone oxidoreductase subunit C